MPAQKTSQIDVNLLPKDSFLESGVGRFLNWSLSTGRYIVIFTELIVILTFISRFTLDKTLSDLNEDIQKKQAILESYKDFEATVRKIQKKAEFIDQLESRINTVDLLDFLSAKAPKDIIFEQLDVRPDGFNLAGVSYSLESFTAFKNLLLNDPQFAGVDLSKVNTTDKDTGISFTAQIQFASKKTAENTKTNPTPAP